MLTSAAELARPIFEAYFRSEATGTEHIPATGPAILVANHGGVLPIEAAVLCLDVLRRTDPVRIPRAVPDRAISRLPLVSALFTRLGVVGGTPAILRRSLERGELIAHWPEGASGPAAPFSEHARIQRWSAGFAELAIRYRAPVVPVAIIGSAESLPVIARLPGARALGIPSAPISAPLRPARYHLRYGRPLALGRMADDADDPGVVAAAATIVRIALEQQIAEMQHARI